MGQQQGDGIQTAPPAPTGFWSSRVFFRPGVRLFRRLRFAPKAWIISAMFLLPMLLLTWHYGVVNREIWLTAVAERDGIAKVRDLAPRLKAVAQGQADEALLDELSLLASRSGLAFDSNPASYFAMDLAVYKLPRLLVLRSQLDGEGATVAMARWQDARADVRRTLNLLAKEDPGRTTALRADAVVADPPAAGAEVLGLADRSLDLLDELIAIRMSQQRQSVLSLCLLTGAALLMAAYLFQCFSLVLSGGIQMVIERVNCVANGVLTAPSHAWGQDEFAFLASRVAEMQSRLVSTMSTVSRSAGDVAMASQDMSLATADLADRTAQGTEKLRETAQSMVEMQAVAERSAGQTGEAAREAQHNAQVAQAGGKEIAEAMTTMEEVQSSASRIHDITSLIDSIAFQTNILALNAAVEAARAGEAGRGFAVGASEVRMLAGRSADAAKEIKTLIQASVNSSEVGAAKVQQAGQTMQTLVASSNTLRDALDQLAGFARDQASRMASVTGTVAALDDMAARNREMVDRTSAAALNMMELSSSLAAEAARFSLPEGEQSKPAADAVMFF